MNEMKKSTCSKHASVIGVPEVDEDFLLKEIILKSGNQKLADVIIYTNNPERAFEIIINRIGAYANYLESLNSFMKITINPDGLPNIVTYKLNKGTFLESSFSPNYFCEKISIDDLGRAEESVKIIDNPRSIFVINFDQLTSNEQRRLMADPNEDPLQCLPFKEWGFIRTKNDSMWFLIDMSKDPNKRLSSTVTNRCSNYFFCV